MGERIRAFDWSATPLGPLEGWPPGVRNVVDLMLDARQPACIAWGPDLTLLYNDACSGLLGSRHPDALGVPWWQLGPHTQDPCRPILEATMAGEAQHFVDPPVALAGQDGGPVRSFTFSLTPLRGGGGIIGFYCAATEKNENVRSQEAALHESQGRFHTLVQSVPDYAILMLDAFGRIVEWTEGAERVKGYAAGEVLGRHVLMFHMPEDVAAGEPERLLARAAHDGRIECEGWRLRKSGERFWVNEIATALRDPCGRLEGFAMVCRDMTLQQRAEEALRAADRRKDEFLAMLAHELRNPLAPIRSALQVLRRGGAETANAPRLLGVIERQIEHMVRLVDDLMDVSRISRGVIGLDREPLDLRDVLRTAVEAIEPAMETRHHAFVLELPEEALPVQGDAVRLAQVFANLLDNAAKYTGDGGHIGLQARCEGAWVVVAVRDDGIGIAAEQFPRLFEMFGQLDHGDAHAGGGLGIGLNLAQRLAQMHGGSLDVASNGPGQGSEFTVRLPLAACSAAVAEAPLRSDAAKPVAKRVLVVDDNRDGAESLGLLLELEGHELRVVHDGASALAEAARQTPQVVLLDLGMPGMDGYEVARRLRSDRRFDGVHLVALTGWGQDEDRRRTREAGFDRHLIKPIELDTLQALLASLPSSGCPGGAPLGQPETSGSEPS